MKKQLTIGILLFFCAKSFAQENNQSFFLNAGTGFHNLSYDLKNGSQKGGLGFTLNTGYNYFFNQHWGLKTGIGIQTLNPTATLNYNTSAPSVDDDGENYEFQTKYNNWKEKQQLLLLDIPLGIQYRQDCFKKLQILASSGIKLSIPVKTTRKAAGGSIVTSGYYSQWNVVLNDLPRHGFTTTTDLPNGNTSLKTSIGGFAELGALYPLSDKIDLYLGGYLDYGLNNIAKTSDKLLYQQDGTYNNVLESNQASKAKLISAGIKVGIQWHFKNRKVKDETSKQYPIIIAPSPTLNQATIEKQPVTQEIPSEKIAEKTVINNPVPEQEKKQEVNQEYPKVITEQPSIKDVPASKTEKKETPYTKAQNIAESIKIYFEFNSSKPGNTEDTKILALSKILKANHSISIRIIGHTDNLGSQKVNKKLGLERANAVKQKFIRNGISNSQLHCEIKTMNVTNGARAKSRVVTIAVK